MSGPTVSRCRARAVFPALGVAVAVAATAVGAAAAGGPPLRQCLKACSGLQAGCIQGARQHRDTLKAACTGDGKARRACLHAARRGFRKGVHECRHAVRRQCRRCCRTGGTDCPHANTTTTTTTTTLPCPPGAGDPCGTSDVGACRRGRLECVGGVLRCVGNVDPTPEICGDGIDQDCDGADVSCPLTVRITSPENLSLTNHSSAALTGTVSAGTVGVVCNDVAAALDAGAFSASVPLREGANLIACVARDAAGHVATASIDVTLDTTPPRVLIASPRDGAMVTSSPITVSGMINDVVVGTVNGAQATVAVDGVAAEVANRSFLAAGVALVPGPNTITAVGRDRAGNTASTRITVDFEPVLARPKVTLVSGNNQRGPIGALLPDPLVVALTAADGAPAAGVTVIFKVLADNGSLSDGTRQARSLAVVSDAGGRAEARWTLGMHAGAGNDMVEATAVGFAGAATFTASALAAAPGRISVDAGNNQTGATGAPLPRPFIVVVTDAGHNRLGGVPVRFAVVQGDATFGGQPSTTVTTDGDGRALALLTLGVEEGAEHDVVEATFPGNPGAPAMFVASAMAPGDPAATALGGVVLDNTNLPVPGVTLRIAGTPLAAVADAEGQFVLRPAPVGHVHLLLDGSTATRPGTWPNLAFELVTVAGRENRLMAPIYLPALDLPHGLAVDETHGGTLTLPDVPGFSLTIAPGSATFPGGGKQGLVTVTVVHSDKVPMTPNFGAQPRMPITIQPPGVLFDPPAPITYPNLDGLAPGEVTDLYSFDHDLGQFVSDGPGTVSEDGTVVRSNPGVGIAKGGWHSSGNPTPTGTPCHCDDGNECTDDACRDGRCRHDPIPATADHPCGAPRSETYRNVHITITESCRGRCLDAGACGETFPEQITPAPILGATKAAIDRVFGNCIALPALRTRMRNALLGGGVTLTCSGEGGFCAQTNSGQPIELTAAGLHDACGSLAAIVFHEMIHSQGGEPGAPGHNEGGVFADPTDVVYGCEKKCFNVGPGDAAACAP